MARRWGVFTVAILGVLFLTGVARAAEGDGERSGRGHGPDRAEREARREQLRERIKMLLMWRLTENLSLTPEESTRFFPVVERLDRIREEAREGQEERTRRIEEMIEGDGAASGLGALLDEYVRSAEERGKREREALEEIRRLLGTERMAKYLVANAKFEREMREMISQRMRGGQGGPGGSGGPGMQGPGGMGGPPSE